MGIAQAAIDEVIALAPTKRTDSGRVLAERSHAHSRIGAAQTSLDAARALLRSAAATISEAAEAGEPVTELLRARMRAAMSHSAAVTRDVLLTCQQLASSTAVYSDTTIERLVRDGNVATQHMILAAPTSTSGAACCSASTPAPPSSDPPSSDPAKCDDIAP